MKRYAIAICAVSLLTTKLAIAQDLDHEVRVMEHLGFQQFSTASRIIVKTTEPARHQLIQTNPTIWELVLEQTVAELANNVRPLDTRFFDSPVLRIESLTIEDPSPSIRIRIHLRKAVKYHLEQHDNIILLDIMR